MTFCASSIENRKKTDTFFPLDAGCIRYGGYQDTLARFVERTQLLRSDLWDVFVKQYTFVSDDCNFGWRGEYWGKMMRGGCMTYAYTKSEKLYRELTRTVKDMLSAQDKLGRFSTYSVENEFHSWDMWCRKYILLGLEYYYEICRSEALKKKIVKALCRHADYIMRFIGSGKQDIRQNAHWGGLNACSILEPYMRLYNLTGKKEYLDFASYIVGTGFCLDADIIRLAEQGVPPYRYPVTKAYEMMSCFEGLLEYARVTGDKKYLEITERFAQSIHDTDVTIIGCCGCTHELFDHSAAVQTEFKEMIMQETCVTVTWMKFCTQLLYLTGKKCYADYIEESALNAMSGAVNDSENKRNEGLTFDSYSPLYKNTRGRTVGGYQQFEGENPISFYGCCACIGSAGTALSCLDGAMTDKDGLAVLFYEKGTLTFRTPVGQTAKLRIISRLPESGKVEMILTVEKPENFRLLLRIPQWSDSFGITTEADVTENRADGYVSLSGKWKNGDRVIAELDVTAHTVTLNGKIALKKAGYVLARDQKLGEYDAPVSIRNGRKHRIRVKAVKTPDFARHAFLVPNGKDEPIMMIDYASAGKNWDEQENCGVTVWMDRK